MAERRVIFKFHYRASQFRRVAGLYQHARLVILNGLGNCVHICRNNRQTKSHRLEQSYRKPLDKARQSENIGDAKEFENVFTRVADPARQHQAKIIAEIIGGDTIIFLFAWIYGRQPDKF